MPPFEYRQAPNPYAASISDLLLRQGDIQAQRATQVGNAQAQAAQARGQIWGTAATGIANSVSGAIQQANDPKEQVAKLQLSEAQRGVQARTALGAAVSATPHVDEDGVSLYDIPAISKKLEEAGFGDHVGDVATQLTGINNAFRTERQAKLALVQRGAQALLQANADPELTMNFIDQLDKNGTFPKGQIDQYRQIIQRDPSKTAAILRQFAGPEKLETAAPGSTIYGSTSGAAVATVPDKPNTEAELALDAANPASPTHAQSAQALETLRAQKNPPSLEEQYLSAKSTGDEAKASQILGTLRETAAAKRDPAAQAMANELGALRKEEAQARLDKLQKDNAPLDIAGDQRTTLSGHSYLDMGDYETAETRQKARDAAKAAGIPVVSKETGDSLKAADQARLNMTAMLNNIIAKLPKDASGRLIAGPAAKLDAYFQTDADKAAFASWRSAAIQAAQAMAEKGMGFRLNQAEIALIQSTDQTQLTDTVETAVQRLRNILTMLDNKEGVALTKDRSALAPDSPLAAKPKIGDRVTVQGKSVMVTKVYPDGTFDAK